MGVLLSQLHNVTLALELLKDEGLLKYPVSPEGECGAHVGSWPRVRYTEWGTGQADSWVGAASCLARLGNERLLSSSMRGHHACSVGDDPGERAWEPKSRGGGAVQSAQTWRRCSFGGSTGRYRKDWMGGGGCRQGQLKGPGTQVWLDQLSSLPGIVRLQP